MISRYVHPKIRRNGKNIMNKKKNKNEDHTISCDLSVIEPMEADINNLIAASVKNIMEVAEEDPNAYSYEEREMKVP